MPWSFKVIEVQRNDTRIGMTGGIFWDDGTGAKLVQGGRFVLGAWDDGNKPTAAEVKASAQAYLDRLIASMTANKQASNQLLNVDVALTGATLPFPVPVE